MKHAFNCAIAEAPPSGGVGPTEWNQLHIMQVDAVSVNTTLGAHDVVNVTTGAGTVTVTLPDATLSKGTFYTIKKVDSGTGLVAVTPQTGQNIEGDTSFELVNQYQYVEIYSDGTNWFIKANN